MKNSGASFGNSSLVKRLELSIWIALSSSTSSKVSLVIRGFSLEKDRCHYFRAGAQIAPPHGG